MNHDIPKKDYKRIAKEIHSDKSPVGIDAKHTHILILHKLEAIEERLDLLEAKLDANMAGASLGLGGMGLGNMGLGDMWDDDEFDEDDMEEGLDRIMGVMLETVENQIKEKDPPAVKLTLDRLIDEEDIPEEQAMKMIATVLYKEMIEVISQGQEFNEFRYIQSLHRLPILPDLDEE